MLVREDGSELEIDATLGRTVFEESDQTGIVKRSTTRDYILKTEQLGGQDPREGERIRDVDEDGTAIECEILPGGGGGASEPAFIRSDPFGIGTRIHTRVVKRTPA